jgi:hypothetical protein
MQSADSRSGLLGDWLHARLPDGLAVQWPGGRVGAARPAVLLKAGDRRVLAHLLLGRVGHLGQAYVRGKLEIDGSLTDLMASVGVLAGDPVRRVGVPTRICHAIPDGSLARERVVIGI